MESIGTLFLPGTRFDDSPCICQKNRWDRPRERRPGIDTARSRRESFSRRWRLFGYGRKNPRNRCRSACTRLNGQAECEAERRPHVPRPTRRRNRVSIRRWRKRVERRDGRDGRMERRWLWDQRRVGTRLGDDCDPAAILNT